MARNYTTSTTTLWRPESKFTRLTGRQQAVYQMLKGQEHITAAGVLPITYKRWAQTASDFTIQTVTDDLVALASEGHIVIDEDTEEVLLVKFIRWDAGYRNIKRQGVIRDAAHRIMSAEIKRAVAEELVSLDALPDVVAALSVCPIAETGIGHTEKPDRTTRSDRVVVNVGDHRETTHNPQSATLLPVAQRPAQKRGTRLPEDWRPSDESRAWTLTQLDQAAAVTELEKFRNHWLAKTGKDATKLDWDRTWRNWVLNSHGRASTRAPQQQTDDLFDRAARRMGVTP